MKKTQLGALMAALVLAACSPSERQPPGVDLGTARESPAPGAAGALTSPAQEDHTHHGAAADPHAGHPAPASGADHAGHAAPAAGEPAGAADHAGHAASRGRADAAAAAAVGHAAHTAPAQDAEHDAPVIAPASPAALTDLVAALLGDPDVQQRIQQDAELREMWSDPTVRRHLAPEAEMSGAMQKLILLIQGLLDDPQVQARVQSDPELRALWADEGVRRRVIEPRQP